MAVGDVVNGVFGAGISTFQPAASVEVAILSGFGVDSQNLDIGIDNGVIAPNNRSTQSGQMSTANNVKIMINNSVYLYLNNATASGYSGIQIK